MNPELARCSLKPGKKQTESVRLMQKLLRDATLFTSKHQRLTVSRIPSLFYLRNSLYFLTTTQPNKGSRRRIKFYRHSLLVLLWYYFHSCRVFEQKLASVLRTINLMQHFVSQFVTTY